MTGKELRMICADMEISFSELARMVGVSRQVVNQWIKNLCPIPKNRAIQITDLYDNHKIELRQPSDKT